MAAPALRGRGSPSSASDEKIAPKQYKMVLVEDHLMFRERLTQMLSRDAGCEVCGEADNIQDAIRIIRATKPDIVIVDITLRGSSGLELLADRELEVFQLIGRGYNGCEIAQMLRLGETPVDIYRSRIKEKLRLRNGAELYSRAAQWVHEQGT